MRPENLKTKIFLDSGDPAETKDIIESLGFLDGQTTNPTLISKNPYAKERFDQGEKFSEQEIFDFYKKTVTEVSNLIPNGSVSIEVYADQNTTAEQMIKQAKEFFQWIANAHIKLPITTQGLKAAEQAVSQNIRVNMTLCFSQAQAAAVHAATKGAKSGDVFLSPFIGRLDDKDENGMDLIANIIKMYQTSDSHVQALTASVRNLDHFLYALKLESDIITVPYKVLKEWIEQSMPIPGDDYQYPVNDSKPISYQEFDLAKSWQEFDISHELTDKGIKQFSQDWNALIK